jgi:hypothetical protein
MAYPPTPAPRRGSPPRLTARLSAYRSRRYSADFASGDGGEDDGGVVEVEATPPRPHARHAAASAKARLSTPTAEASLACPVERCTGLASLSAALHAWHFTDEPGIIGAASIRRTDDTSPGGDPDTRCDSSTAKLSLGLNPRDRAREPLPIAPTDRLRAPPFTRTRPSNGTFRGSSRQTFGVCRFSKRATSRRRPKIRAWTRTL